MALSATESPDFQSNMPNKMGIRSCCVLSRLSVELHDINHILAIIATGLDSVAVSQHSIILMNHQSMWSKTTALHNWGTV